METIATFHRWTLCSFCLILFCLGVVLPGPSTAQISGRRDQGFGTNGFASLPLGEVYGMGIQSDGKIVVAGYLAGKGTSNPCMARFLPDGQPDETFGEKGAIYLYFGEKRNAIKGIAIQKDEKIILVGEGYNGTNYDLLAVRMMPDGKTFDQSFGYDGLISFDVLGRTEFGKQILLSPDGKIMLSGSTDIGSDYDFLFARLHSNGMPDTTFGRGGLYWLDEDKKSQGTAIMSLGPNGQLTTAGTSAGKLAVFRHSGNGDPDPSFHGNGGVLHLDGNKESYLFTTNTLHIEQDGSMMIAGTIKNGIDDNIILFRLNNNGSLDTRFGKEGMATIALSSEKEQVQSMLVDPEGNILICGQTRMDNRTRMFLIRLKPDGTLDSGFSNNGKFITSEMNNATGMKVINRNKILICGYVYDGDIPKACLLQLNLN